MAGVYFMAAGGSSQNRAKSLDRPLDRSEVERLLDSEDRERLREPAPLWVEYVFGAYFRLPRFWPKPIFLASIERALA